MSQFNLLQTFHTGESTRLRSELSGSDEEAAVAYVTGRTAPKPPAGVRTGGSRLNSGESMVEVEVAGVKYPVKIGPSLATEKQAKWMIDIATTRETPGPAEAVLTRLEQGFARHAASQFITNYKDLPRKPKVPSAAMMEAVAPGADSLEFQGNAGKPVRDAVGVPAGRYAIRTEEGVKFFKVRLGKGRWEGRTFVEAQASDDLYPIRNPQRRQEILEEIAKDTVAAERLYGRELGKCARCGRTLTDETSRAHGIGPECRKKM
jgi:uncharacterized protein DUF6011